jgi:hypothetical protein
MLSSDVRKLMNFTKQTVGLSGEALVEFCITNDVAVITSHGYNPFWGRSEAEKLEWMLFVLFLSRDWAAVRVGFDPDDAWGQVEYLLQRPFQNVDEWLGAEGDKWRRAYGMNRPSERLKTRWVAFRDAHRHLSLADVEAEHKALCARFREAKDAGVFKSAKRRRRRAMGR